MVMNGVILSLSCHKSIILCVCVCVGECECECVSVCVCVRLEAYPRTGSQLFQNPVQKCYLVVCRTSYN